MKVRPLCHKVWTVAATAAAGALAAGCGAPDGTTLAPDDPVERVLVVSLPGVGWKDVQDHDLPNLQEFVTTATIGGVPPSIGQTEDSTIEAYMTLGAGTRAVAPEEDKAVALEDTEYLGGVSASELFERRLGYIPRGVTYLPMGAAVEANELSPFGANIGILGDALADAGINRAVFANADGIEGIASDEPLPDGVLARGAATAIMDSDGTVPGGIVDRSLLKSDPLAPFGVSLDHAALLDGFDEVWNGAGRSVVLVEASDLSRAAAYRARVTPEQREKFRQTALREADALLGELLERVNHEHDAVIVLSPVSAPGLGIATVSAPGVEPALLRSATTRRDGYIQLADFAPTVLSLLGEEVPTGIEGRPFDVTTSTCTSDAEECGAADDRIESLANDAAAAERHDALLPLVFGAAAVAVAVLLVALRFRGRFAMARRAIVPLAFGVLGFVPATFLVGGIDALAESKAGYLSTVALFAIVIGIGTWLIERWKPGLGVLSAVAIILGLIAVDLLTGAALQVNTAFGYSLAVAGRFVGLGNLAFGLLGSAAIVLAALLVDRYGRRGWAIAIGILAVVVLIVGLPMVGADVGGLLSTIPAFGVTALLLAGRPIRLKGIAWLGVVTAASLLIVAFIDATRPAEMQTHLVRSVEDLLEGRWSGFAKTVGRRWTASFGDAELTGWLFVAILMIGAGTYAVLAATGRVGPAAENRQRGPFVAAAVGLVLLGGLGVLVNDSSFAVPATMLLVVVPVLALRRGTADRRPL